MKVLRNVLLAMILLLGLNCGAWWLVGKGQAEHDLLLDWVDEFIGATRAGVASSYYLLVCPSSKKKLSPSEWTLLAKKLEGEGIELISSDSLDESGRAPQKKVRTAVCTELEKENPLFVTIRVSSGVGLRAGYGRSYFEHRVYLAGYWIRIYRSGDHVY